METKICSDCGRFAVPVFGFATQCSESTDGAHRNINTGEVSREDVARMMYAKMRCESPVVLARLVKHFAPGSENHKLLELGKKNAR